MRDFRDSKSMAQTLRDVLTAKTVAITHSESLEIISKLFGFDNWNILSAEIEADRRAATAALQHVSAAGMAKPPGPPGKETLYCSFCGKSQNDVKKLVAGPKVFICDECIDLCDDIVDEGGVVALIDKELQGASLASLLESKTVEELVALKMNALRSAARTMKSLDAVARIDRTKPPTSAFARFICTKSPEELFKFVGGIESEKVQAERIIEETTTALRERGI